MKLFSLIKPILHAFDPETAHQMTISALKHGLYPRLTPVNDPRLYTKLWHLKFKNPIGLAAGFDKNAEAIAPILNMGFGFTEIGTVTPKPQMGNPRPRIFRDVTNEAVINRMGFPNKGVGIFRQNIQKFVKSKKRTPGVVGLNIGMNKDQTKPANDYIFLIKHLGHLAHYFTVNISSPNTPGLRDLQSRENLMPLIAYIQEARETYCESENLPPILVKLAPDLNEEQQQELADVAIDSGIDGLILTNTTLDRPDSLPEAFSAEKGGLSGQPVKDKSTEVIKNFYVLTQGKIPIIGVGGVSSGADAYEKIKAGASLVQLYSALIFQGPELVNDINHDLLTLLEEDGFDHISQAIGTAHQ